MSSVRIRELSKRFPGRPPATAIESIDLDIEDGEFVVLLGPSGCGKTTTLRCVAGLEKGSTGRVDIGGRTVFDARSGVDLPPNQRDIGMVFQSYGLWPHMSVRKNIDYPLRARRLHEGRKGSWVDDAAALVDCKHLLDRYPAQLSGGQQQRVALARSLVARPSLVLFDEPLSNLDARLRDQVRQELHELHSRVRFTALFVTHDQPEALALADRLVVMNSGRIEQCDTPQVVFDHPNTEYVAGFMGMTNRLVLTRTGQAWTCGEVKVVDAARLSGLSGVADGGSAAVRIRPEDVTVLPVRASVPVGHTSLLAEVTDVAYGGRHLDVTARVGAQRVLARVTDADARHHVLDSGGRDLQVRLAVPDVATRVFALPDAAPRTDDRVDAHSHEPEAVR
jgi:iron(III) transport system ATP-binding protein